jgi:nucleotide-binding universal stress UspA family protein
MTAFQNILVPTDFSPHADEAIRTAADLARRYAGAVTLLYVYEPVAQSLPNEHVLRSPRQMRELFALFEQRLAGAKVRALEAGTPRVETRLVVGPAAPEIVELAQQGGFDLIVMGTHGRTGFSRWLEGSVAERVVRTASCPVLTVRLLDRSQAATATSRARADHDESQRHVG